MSFYIGVDVGSGSVRAVIVDRAGNLKSRVSKNIKVWNSKPDYYQQSSRDIWLATCDAIKEALKIAEVTPDQIHGLGFDATCSLVVLDKNCQPLTIGPPGEENDQNVVMWMDHRAIREAEYVTKLEHPLLLQYGKTLSVESNISKILWLKNNMKAEWWDSVGYFFDLPDFMTCTSTGNYNARSLCSLVCKLGYPSNDKSEHKWDESFWEQINLKDDLGIGGSNNKLGTVVHRPGELVGGLCKSAAEALGLNENTFVATSLIDAHSGALALWSCRAPNLSKTPLSSRLAMICGTSTCHMAIRNTGVYHNGIWGPFYSIILPNLWVEEAGQSTAGKLLDYILDSHPATDLLCKRLPIERTPVEELHSILIRLKNSKGLSSIGRLTRELHVWPDFHGNRSPLANPTLKGMISGLTLDNSEEDLAVLYLATIQALAYGTKLIINELQSKAPTIEVILMCGGLSRNSLYVQTHADVTGLKVVIPKEDDSVALGAAILGANATCDFQNLEEAMDSMGGEGDIVHPEIEDLRFHESKFQVFMKLVSHQIEYQQIMKEFHL